MEPGNQATGDAALFERAAAWLRAGREFALATLIADRGSTPRKRGAKMLIARGETCGTIGGGAVEAAVEAAATQMLDGGEAFRSLDFNLDGVAGPVCGGELTVTIEAFRHDKSIAIVGAGHVAAALCPLLQRLGWRVIVCDERPGRLALPEFAGAERLEAPFDQVAERLPYGPRLHVLVMTPEHAHDLAVIRGAIEREWRWLGALGSRRKTAEFQTQLRAAGVGNERLAKLRMPVGVEIGSESPDEIAVSIAAELIALHSRKARP